MSTQKQHPLALIRRELAKDPDWEPYSTHAGFAELVGRSKSRVKNLEYGIAPVTAAFAQRVADRLGIDPAWLLAPPPATYPIPAVGGGAWNAGMIPGRLKSALEGNVRTLGRFLTESRAEQEAEVSARPRTPFEGLADITENQVFLADVLARHVRDRLVEEFRSGRPEQFLTQLRQLLKGVDE